MDDSTVDNIHNGKDYSKTDAGATNMPTAQHPLAPKPLYSILRAHSTLVRRRQ